MFDDIPDYDKKLPTRDALHVQTDRKHKPGVLRTKALCGWFLVPDGTSACFLYLKTKNYFIEITYHSVIISVSISRIVFCIGGPAVHAQLLRLNSVVPHVSSSTEFKWHSIGNFYVAASGSMEQIFFHHFTVTSFIDLPPA